uniref:Uncharacterized protein n=1 Tax=Glossina brevipalpis TaxID=37001 RepID=A0A1A9W445_9MUSC
MQTFKILLAKHYANAQLVRHGVGISSIENRIVEFSLIQAEPTVAGPFWKLFFYDCARPSDVGLSAQLNSWTESPSVRNSAFWNLLAWSSPLFNWTSSLVKACFPCSFSLTAVYCAVFPSLIAIVFAIIVVHCRALGEWIYDYITGHFVVDCSRTMVSMPAAIPVVSHPYHISEVLVSTQPV